MLISRRSLRSPRQYHKFRLVWFKSIWRNFRSSIVGIDVLSGAQLLRSVQLLIFFADKDLLILSQDGKVGGGGWFVVRRWTKEAACALNGS